MNSDDEESSRLLVMFEGKDVKCTKTPPATVKKKGKTMFFLKVTREPLEIKTIKEQVRDRARARAGHDNAIVVVVPQADSCVYEAHGII